MRLGVMIGAERGDMARKVSKLISDIEWADSAGLATAWMPQVPDDFDLLTMVALMASHSTRIELGTAVVPLQAQHPIALARQALSVHAVSNGRLALGVGPSHHWIIRDMLGLPYDKPAAYTRDYLQVFNAAISGPGPVDVENDTFTVHNPTALGAATPMPVLVAALGPVMLQDRRHEHADGTSLWMADEKAIGEHIAPKINKAAAEAWVLATRSATPKRPVHAFKLHPGDIREERQDQQRGPASTASFRSRELRARTTARFLDRGDVRAPARRSRAAPGTPRAGSSRPGRAC
ncbi:MAG: LLM class flavin-dependent oxidoreductase [Mycobacterium sp.]|nr:LLM class flavin-dependent oxidoreductase [Mycobacterium sp.]